MANAPQIFKRTRLANTKKMSENEGRLCLGLSDKNYVEIDGRIRVYLNFIKKTSGNNREVSLTFVADKSIKIERGER